MRLRRRQASVRAYRHGCLVVGGDAGRRDGSCWSSSSAGGQHQAKKNAYSFSFFPLLLFLPPFPLFLGMLAVVVDFEGVGWPVWLRCVNWVLREGKTKIQQRLRGVDDGLGWGQKNCWSTGARRVLGTFFRTPGPCSGS